MPKFSLWVPFWGASREPSGSPSPSKISKNRDLRSTRSPRPPQDASKTPPRLRQDRFGLDLGGFWDDFWVIFDRILMDSSLMYEWWMTNDECRMINDECWMMTAVTSKKTRLNRSPNSKLGAVTSKKARLNRFPSKQWTRCCYIKKGKTKPFPIQTVNSVLLHRKRQN